MLFVNSKWYAMVKFNSPCNLLKRSLGNNFIDHFSGNIRQAEGPALKLVG